MRKLSLKLFFPLLILAALSGCDDSNYSNEESVETPSSDLGVTEYINFPSSEVSVNVDEEVSISFDSQFNRTTNFKLSYDNQIIVASVNSNEKTVLIRGLLTGVTTLTISEINAGKSDSIKVVVNESAKNPGIYDNDIDKFDDFHYLVFMVSEEEVARIVVLPTDTYESLQPYFPTIKEITGYISYWEIIDSVYDIDQKVIRLNAYYEFDMS